MRKEQPEAAQAARDEPAATRQGRRHICTAAEEQAWGISKCPSVASLFLAKLTILILVQLCHLHACRALKRLEKC